MPHDRTTPNQAWAVILAAGNGARLAASGLRTRKQFLSYLGEPLFWHSARTFARVPGIQGLVFVFPPREADGCSELVSSLDKDGRLGLPWMVAGGGSRRQDSVYSGLRILPHDARFVLVHDAARPFLTPELVTRLLEVVSEESPAVIPGVAVSDTIKQIKGGRVTQTLVRDHLRAVQTPQAFDADLLRKAHETAYVKNWDVTDDAGLVEQLGHDVLVVEGDPANVKITTPQDLKLLEEGARMAQTDSITGFGYDVHRYVEDGRPLKLGGVPIPGGPAVQAHSDGDCLLHALADAMLGLVGEGDIGQLFPDNDPRYDNVSSAALLSEVRTLLTKRNVRLTHVDLTVIAQVPRIAPHREEIRKTVARLLGLDLHRVALKATTEEGLGFTGEKRGIKAVAVVSALRGAS